MSHAVPHGLAVALVAVALTARPARAQTSTPPVQTTPSGSVSSASIQTLPASTTTSSGFTRSLFGATGRMLTPGEVTITGIAIVLPFVQVGVTDWLEIGGGGIGGAAWVTPKVRVYHGDRTRVAAGAVHAWSWGRDSGATGVAYVVATRESGRGAWTVGGGLGYSVDSRGDTELGPMVQLGGERRLSRRVWLLTDNYLIGSVGVLSAGLRVQWRYAFLDAGLPAVIYSGEVAPAAIVNVGVRFGG